MFTTKGSAKYAITGEPTAASGSIKLVNDGANTVFPGPNDIVVVEYTGYLSNGKIFDATHTKGKGKEIAFKLGDQAVIPGIQDMVSQMRVGESVQAIIPPNLGYPKGVCFPKKDGSGEECLIEPGATIVYDILLTNMSIAPP